MQYNLFLESPTQHLIRIEIPLQLPASGKLALRLSLWRPGRYERQRFDRLVSDFELLDDASARITRLDGNSWEISGSADTSVTLKYRFYANQADAGGSYFDKEVFYLNPINCLLYTEESLTAPCQLQINLPEDFEVACGLPHDGGQSWRAEDFHQLVDAPLLAARRMQHHEFSVKGISFHFWFAGDCRPDFARIERDARMYTEAQLAVFGEFPVESYHYLCLMRHERARHGVEHYNSTVIAMGPGWQLNHPNFYRSFIEICSHELFHTWNVKQLRPQALLPYDYNREVVTELHYVTEGVTTYYGDMMIWRGGGWSLMEWLDSLNGELKKFFLTPGHSRTSLAQASRESWINGYTQEGFPHRRVSFYNKGYLVTFLLDYRIRKATGNAYSMDDVMHLLYHNYAKVGKGYTREDYLQALQKISGESFTSFFSRFVDGTDSLVPELEAAGAYYGFRMYKAPPPFGSLARFGLRLDPANNRIEDVWPDSPAESAGFSVGDVLVSLAGRRIDGNFDELWETYGAPSAEIHYFHRDRLRRTDLELNDAYRPTVPQFGAVANVDERQLANLRAWQLPRQIRVETK